MIYMNKSSKALLIQSLPWIFLAFWVLLNPGLWHSRGFLHQVNSIGSIFGAASFFVFSFSFLFITKWKKLEDWFWGLDKVFRFHQFLGKVGYSCLIIHILTFSLKWARWSLSSYFLYPLPVHHRLSVNLGSYAFIFMTLILAITIFKLLPYHLWKILHKWMSIVFLLSFLHFFLSDKAIGNDLSNSLLYLAALIGLGCAAYKQVFYALLVKPVQYRVAKVDAINETLLKVTLTAKNKNILCIPGQYAFIYFREPNFSKEQHPFTLARDEKSNNLLIHVKSRGDYTKALHHSLESGWTALIEGPYGRLDYRSYQKQIWIAGGIGIALFLSWMHSLKPAHGKTIDLFFCCHNRSDLAILKEFEKLKSNASGIRIFTFCSEDNKRFSCNEITRQCPDYKERKIFMCGPQRLTHDMRKQLIALSVTKDSIEYEDFNFF